ncbi:hypothetical protein CC2G_004443 [Coprinopsis cinerea AmutBmut pab1-1]|nr:hypothetical protein CC2G_004443 [Coprinopsis cinerea AmutBmut pab1-1]
MSSSTFVDLVFSYEANKDLYQQAFCVNPPDGECPFSPCPNGDVTGIGSQVSVYATTIIYALVLAYIPWLKRPMLYAYLSLVFSLQIAGLVSILKNNLSLTDALFVLICVASPATFYMWYLSIRSLWNPSLFPILRDPGAKPKPLSKSKEVHILRVVIFLNMAFEIALICMVFIPTRVTKLKFSQPACNQKFGTKLWFNLAWELPYAMQMVGTFLFLGIAWAIFKGWTSMRFYEVPTRTNPVEYEAISLDTLKTDGGKNQIDIITWTETVLCTHFPNFMTRTLAISIATILQISTLPTSIWYVYSKDILSWLILLFGCFAQKPKPGSNWWVFYGMRIFSILFLGGYAFLRMLGFDEFLPTVPDVVSIFLLCTVAAWSCAHFDRGNVKVFLPIFLVLTAIVITVANYFVVLVGDSKIFAAATGGFNAPDDNFSYFQLSMMTVSGWLIAWMATSAWPWRVTLTWDKLFKGLWKRAHILKFCWFIAGPHILWIQACNNTNPSNSKDMAFGQIFAIIVTALTIFTLLDEMKDVKMDVWWAFVKSREMPQEDEGEKPKHYAPKPGLGMS